MPITLLLCGDPQDTALAASSVGLRVPETASIEVAHPWDLAPRARDVRPDVVVLLRGPITDHDRRVEAVEALRRDGFPGRVLYSGSFLTERQDALAAGADLVFDPMKRSVDAVVEAALYRPVLAADHPYLRYLCLDEWARVMTFAADLPAQAPAVLLAATSCHKDAAFWSKLAEFAQAHRGTSCIVVEDDTDEDVHAEALSCGVQPYVPLAQQGLPYLHRLVRRLLREDWLARVLA